MALVRRIDKPRGVLRPLPAEAAGDEVAHERYLPTAELAGAIEHFWTVAWRVGAPVVREVMAHPSVHVVIERGSSRVVGVPRGRFTRRLEGAGFVVGIKFLPGAFRPLVDVPVSRLTDRSVALDDVFGARGRALEAAVLAQPTMADRIAAATVHLTAWLPAPDPTAAHAAAVVQRILDDRAIRKVEDVARIFGASPRALQRLFHDYVGVTPKWVIRRYRLHEALERMDAGAEINWPALALDLGYFDQAHFSRDFKKLVGRTPTGYAAISASASPSPAASRGRAAAQHRRRRARTP